MKKKLVNLLAAVCLTACICICTGGSKENAPAVNTVVAAGRAENVFPVAGEAAIRWNIREDGKEGREGKRQEELSALPDKGTLRAAVTGDPHKAILEAAVPYMLEEGYGLEVILCEDYSAPNTLVAAGEAEVNYFQHSAYLERFNTEKGTDLVAVDRLYYEPVGLYTLSQEEMAVPAQGTQILVPENATGLTRALFLLEELGWITLMPDADMTAVWEDVEDNPYALALIPMEESKIPAALQEGQLGVFHKSYTILESMTTDCRAVIEEHEESYMLPELAYILVAAEGKQEDPGIRTLSEVLTSPEIQEFVQLKYGGALHMFEQKEPPAPQEEDAGEKEDIAGASEEDFGEKEDTAAQE